MKGAITAFALVLVLAACGGDAAPSPSAASAPSTSAPSSTTTAAPSTTAAAPSTTAADGAADSTTTAPPPATTATTTTAAPAPTRVRPDGEDAPDFTLALAQGGSFTLSDEQKPVYMVFWAEW